MPVTLSGATNGARGSSSSGPSRASNNVNGQGANSDVSIAELIRDGQWTVSWPTDLILGADALAPRRARTPFVVKNAKTSIAELRSYIAEPRPITVKRTIAGVPKTMKVTFLSAERVIEIAAALESVNGNPNSLPKKPAWLKPAAVALLAEMQWPAGTAVTTQAIIDWGKAYLQKPPPENGQVLFVTNQRLTQIYHQVALKTGEMDALDIVDQLSEVSLQYASMAVQWDEDTGVFTSVRTVMYESDMRFASSFRPDDKLFVAVNGLTPTPDAFDGPFKLEPVVPVERTPEGHIKMRVFDHVTNAPFLHRGEELIVAGPNLRKFRSYFMLTQKNGELVLDPSGKPQLATFDRGHGQANTQFVDRESQEESFSMGNMHAQVPFSNQAVWLNLEQMIRDEIAQNPGCRAVDITGVLFARSANKPGVAENPFKIDSRNEDPTRFTPLSEAERVYINGATQPNKPSRDVPVPSHSYKAVLFQKPGSPKNTYYVRCFIVNNSMNLDPKSKPLEVSLKQLEQILRDTGQPQTFFEDLPADIRAEIENGNTVDSELYFVRAAPSDSLRYDDVA